MSHSAISITSGNQPAARLTACILAGGRGTRLRSVVADRPKVLAEVHGRPFLAFLLDQLVDAGVRRIVLLTGYMGDLVRSTFGTRYRDADLAYSREDEPLGTAGAIRQALPLVDTDTLLVMNGDSYSSGDLNAYVTAHVDSGRPGSLQLVHVPDAGRYGLVRFDDSGRVTSFEEKKPGAGSGWINAGVYLLDRTLVRAIPAGRQVSLERDGLPHWLDAPIGVHLSIGRFLDIGLPETYAETETFFANLGHGRSAVAA